MWCFLLEIRKQGKYQPICNRETSTRQYAIPTWKPVRHPPAIPGSCIRNTTWMSVVPSCHNCCNPSPPRLYCEPSTRQHAIPTWKPVRHPPAIPGSCIRNTTWMSVVPSCHNCCNPSPPSSVL